MSYPYDYDRLTRRANAIRDADYVPITAAVRAAKLEQLMDMAGFAETVEQLRDVMVELIELQK